jgi:hypothetical protein
MSIAKHMEALNTYVYTTIKKFYYLEISTMKIISVSCYSNVRSFNSQH